jgi:methylglutaconyl-CoA hydratase
VIRAIGARAARRYFLTAERFGAEEAYRLGLVHEVAEPDALETHVAALVAEILKGGPEAQAEAKRLVGLIRSMPEGGSLLAEATVGMIAERRALEEGKEGIAAFLEKRAAGWVSMG